MLTLDEICLETSTDSSMMEDRAAPVIETTLYDLMNAMQAEVESGEEDLVVVAIVQMFRSGRIKFHRGPIDYDQIK
jgi:uncharacterized protein (UPF0218 family)